MLISYYAHKTKQIKYPAFMTENLKLTLKEIHLLQLSCSNEFQNVHLNKQLKSIGRIKGGVSDGITALIFIHDYLKCHKHAKFCTFKIFTYVRNLDKITF